MPVTLDTSHLDMSPLNFDALENMFLMMITLDTSHDPMGPCGPLEQSVGDSFRHFTMAPRSSDLDWGGNTVVYNAGVTRLGLV